MFKSSEEPLLPVLRRFGLEELAQYQTANQIIFNVTVGIIVSLFIYVLVVWFPERAKRKRIKSNLRRQYDSFKEECIQEFLRTLALPSKQELIDELMHQKEFKRFFDAKCPKDESQSKWEAVYNRWDDSSVRCLTNELEIFRQEVQFTLNSIDVPQSEVFTFLKRLSRVLYYNQQGTTGYERKKQLWHFLYCTLAGWDMVKGVVSRDVIADMIEAL